MNGRVAVPQCLLAAALLSACPVAMNTAKAAETGGIAKRDGQHDFDFEFGLWKTHLKRRLRPLAGANEWVEYDGTTLVRRIWQGRSNIAEREVAGNAGHLEGASWRLYNPESHQWSLTSPTARSVRRARHRSASSGTAAAISPHKTR